MRPVKFVIYSVLGVWMRQNHNQHWRIMTYMNRTLSQEREIHIAFKTYKAFRFNKEMLTDRQIELLKVYYGV